MIPQRRIAHKCRHLFLKFHMGDRVWWPGPTYEAAPDAVPQEPGLPGRRMPDYEFGRTRTGPKL
jgi:hypothetical protein